MSRRDLFDRVERAALLRLPDERFVLSEWKRATVNVDYHVQLAEHFYSVPYTLVREEVEARLTATTIELCYKSKRAASHPRSFVRFHFTTDPVHMPEAHKKHFAGTDAVLGWASSVGPMTEADDSPDPRREPDPRARVALREGSAAPRRQVRRGAMA